MKVRLTCTLDRFNSLALAADRGRSKHVAVLRQALKDLMLDHGRLLIAMRRLPVDLIEPGMADGNHDLNRAERAVMVEGRE